MTHADYIVAGFFAAFFFMCFIVFVISCDEE